METNEEQLRQALRQALELLHLAQDEIRRLRLAMALLTHRGKRGRPAKAARPQAARPGRRPRYSQDDLAAVAEYMPAIRKQSAYREWLAQYDLRDSKTSALTYVLAAIYPSRGLRSARAFQDVETFRRRLSEWEKKRAK